MYRARCTSGLWSSGMPSSRSASWKTRNSLFSLSLMFSLPFLHTHLPCVRCLYVHSNNASLRTRNSIDTRAHAHVPVLTRSQIATRTRANATATHYNTLQHVPVLTNSRASLHAHTHTPPPPPTHAQPPSPPPHLQNSLSLSLSHTQSHFLSAVVSFLHTHLPRVRCLNVHSHRKRFLGCASGWSCTVSAFLPHTHRRTRTVSPRDKHRCTHSHPIIIISIWILRIWILITHWPSREEYQWSRISICVSQYSFVSHFISCVAHFISVFPHPPAPLVRLPQFCIYICKVGRTSQALSCLATSLHKSHKSHTVNTPPSQRVQHRQWEI